MTRWGGAEAARKRTAVVDESLRATVGPALAATTGVALCAVGSYGRRELTPHSDVDILLLHGLRANTAIEDVTRSVLYPLWDLGLELGYAVRTVKECVQAGRGDPVIATTLYDTRLVAGDASLPADLSAELDRRRSRRRGALERALMQGLAERHARYGDCGSAAEPHVKEGRGGLRDLQTLRWLEAQVDLEEELDLLLALRSAIHELAGKRDDRLLRERIEGVAGALGCTGDDPRDTLMREIYVACRGIGGRLGRHALAVLAPPRKIRPPAGFEIIGDHLERTGRAAPAADPAAALSAARLASVVAPGPLTMMWAGTGGAAGNVAWTTAARHELTAFLRDAPREGWEFLDVTGLWTRYLPELARTRAKAQHNPLHEMAVDAHGWRALECARAMEHDPDPLVAGVYAELERPDLLHMAALLHDIGKGSLGDHSRSGVVLVRRLCERIGFGADVEEVLAFLVSGHLLMSAFATSRDLNDESLVLALAARIGHPQRLRLLYLLSIADARATGPNAWSPWKAELLAELYLKLAGFVDVGDLVGREVENTLSRKRAAALVAAAGDDTAKRAAAEMRLDGLGRRYLLAQPVERIALHVRMLDGLEAGGRLGVIEPEGETVSVVTRDRPGLLAILAGVLAVNGISVRTADVYTSGDGTALDVMAVADSHDDAVSDVKWVRVAADLEAALAGELEFEGRLADRSGRYDRETGGDSDVVVEVDDHASDWYSVVEVHAPDRVGLLSDLAAVLTDEGLDVHFAKVATEGRTAHDSFSVRRDGAKVSDGGALAVAVVARLAARRTARRPDVGT
ncbi:MAG: ACT domain-containing protein [Acidimicrobiia bacterium]